jgi:hypothetical protein
MGTLLQRVLGHFSGKVKAIAVTGPCVVTAGLAQLTRRSEDTRDDVLLMWFAALASGRSAAAAAVDIRAIDRRRILAAADRYLRERPLRLPARRVRAAPAARTTTFEAIIGGPIRQSRWTVCSA